MNVHRLIPGIETIALLDDKRFILARGGRWYHFLTYENVVPEPSSVFDESRIVRAVHSQANEICEAAPRNMRLTRCDLLILLSYARSPHWWDEPMESLCREFREGRAIERLTAVVRGTYRSRRGEYQYKQFDPPFKGITPRLTPERIDALCNENLNVQYIKRLLKLPLMKIMVATRLVPSSSPPDCLAPACYRPTRKKVCTIPRPIDIYRNKQSGIDVSTVSFAQFKRMLQQRHPNPTERAVALCGMPRRPIIGGFAVFQETPENLTIFILCSNRSIGQNILDELKKRHKTIYIDQPLAGVIPFYQKAGFIIMQDQEKMEWRP